MPAHQVPSSSRRRLRRLACACVPLLAVAAPGAALGAAGDPPGVIPGWPITAAGTVDAAPMADGGATVAVHGIWDTGATSTLHGELMGLSAAGLPRWRYRLERDTEVWGMVPGPGRRTTVLIGHGRTLRVEALDHTGHRVWRTAPLRGYRASGIPVITAGPAGGTVIAAAGITARLDARGRIVWADRTGRAARTGGDRALATGADGTVYVAFHGGLEAHGRGGTVRWGVRERVDEVGLAIARDGTLRFVSSRGLRAYSAAGRRLWSTTGTGLRGGTGTGPTAIALAPDGTAYVSDGIVSERLRAVGPDGIPRWTASIGGEPQSVVVTADGGVVAATSALSGGRGIAAVGPDGTLRWRTALNVSRLSLAPRGRILGVDWAGSLIMLGDDAGAGAIPVPDGAAALTGPIVVSPARIAASRGCTPAGRVAGRLAGGPGLEIRFTLTAPEWVTVAVSRAGRTLGEIAGEYEVGNFGEAYVGFMAQAGPNRMLADTLVLDGPAGTVRCLTPGTYRLTMRVGDTVRTAPLVVTGGAR